MTKTLEQISAEAIALAAAEAAMAVVGEYSTAAIWRGHTPEEAVRAMANKADADTAIKAGYGDDKAYDEAFKALKLAHEGDGDEDAAMARIDELEQAAIDEAVEALDFNIFDGDIQSLHSTADASMLWVEGADIEVALEEALDPDNAYDSIEVEVYTTAKINGGHKHLLVGTFNIQVRE